MKVIIENALLSYAHLLEPTAMSEGQEKKYSVSLVIKKDDEKAVNAIKDAINGTAGELKEKCGGKLPAKWMNPLRDGDEERPDDEIYKGCYFMNVKCNKKPPVIDIHGKKCETEEEVYSGCRAHVSCTSFAYNSNGNKGISFGLNAVMVVERGENIGGGTVDPMNEFADFITEPKIEDLI